MNPTHPRRSRKTVATASLILLSAALGSACGGSPGAAVSVSSIVVLPAPLVGHWLALSFITVGALRPIPADLAVGIRFAGASSVQIDTGCSQGSALAAFSSDSTFGSSFVLSDLALTPTGTCDESAIALEGELVDLLAHPLSWDVHDDQLKLLPTDMTDSGLILRTAAAGEPVAQDSVPALVAVAAAHRVRSANGFDTPNVFSSVAILDRYAVALSDGLLDIAPGTVVVPDDIRRAIEVALGPITVKWVADAADVPSEPNSTWDEQPLPAVLRLSEPVLDGPSAVVISELLCGPGCVIGGGQAFDLGVDGSWTVGAAIGAQWQS